MKAFSSALILAGLVSTTAFAGEVKSPLFGSATAHVTTASQNKATVGKGTYADYWGYYGNYYSYEAGLYGYYAYGSGSDSSTSNYLAAYQYASAATTAYQNAYEYAYYGY